MTDPLLATLPVLVCQRCGAQRELPPTLPPLLMTEPRTPSNPNPDIWLACDGCHGTKFSLRMRVPLAKSEPHP